MTGTADPSLSVLVVVIRVQPMDGKYHDTTLLPTSQTMNQKKRRSYIRCVFLSVWSIQVSPSFVLALLCSLTEVVTKHLYGLFKSSSYQHPSPLRPPRHAIPGSSKGDIFGGPVNRHRRAKSTISHSSVYTQSTQATADSLRFWARSASTTGTGLASEVGEYIVEGLLDERGAF